MRFLFKLVLVLVAVAVFAVGALFFMPQDRLGAIVSTQLSRQLGRDVIVGSVRLTLRPLPTLEARSLSIANADWATPGPMVEARRASIRIDAMAALSGVLSVSAIEIDGPVIALEQDKDGRANWELAPDEAATATSAGEATAQPGDPLSALTLDRLTISEGQIRLVQAGTPVFALRDVDLDLQWPDADGPAEISATLTPFSAPVALDATIGAPRILMAGGVSDMTLSLAAAKGKAGFDGRLGLAPELAGVFDAALPDTAAFLAAFGIDGVDLPKGAGRAISGTGQITMTQGQEMALRQAVLRIDDNTMTVNADVSLAGKPTVTATVEAAMLDFSNLTGGGASEPKSGSSGPSGWPKETLDASGLGLVDGEISINASALRAGGLTFGPTRTLLTIDNSRAVFAIESMEAYDGTVDGRFVANNRGGLSVGGKLTLTDIALKPVLTDAAGIDRLSGRSTMSFDFLGSGQSVDAIMRSLSGSGVLKAGPGVIAGIDLDRLFRDGQAAGGTTVFDTLSATFDLQSGVLRNSDLTMGLPRLGATGEGKVDLGGQSIDYLITARDPQARDGRGFAIPVRIKGPWSAPTIRADGGAIIDQNFAEEREKLKDEVRDKVNNKLQKELGVRVEEGQKVEDVLKQKIEEEVGKKLLNLLGR